MNTSTGDLSRSTFAIAMTVVLTVAALVRFVFPLADPPWRATVGIVWHDEGAWVHNARNRAVFGAWRLDEWNPMYIAPVFTGLEYLSFRTLGTGLAQARLVSEVGGLCSVLWLGLAVARAGGRRAGLMAAMLLATNFVYVMWNRAALLETTMVVFLVASLYAYARARESPPWGVAAGICAWLAFFSKAAAAFFIPALALVAAWPVIAGFLGSRAGADSHPPTGNGEPPTGDGQQARVTGNGQPATGNGQQAPETVQRAGYYTLAGLVAGAVLALVVFVGPNWTEYWFYNWQVSVTRKPSYTARALFDRVTWFPILHDAFTRTWIVLVAAVAGLWTALARWSRLDAIERLLVAWLVAGVLELLLHDVGNERRFVVLIPAMCGVAGLLLGRGDRVAMAIVSRSRVVRSLLAAATLYSAYVVIGPIARLPFLYEVRPAVRLSAALALAATITLYARRRRWPVTAGGATFAPAVATAILATAIGADLVQFGWWAAGRTYRNYEAMRVVAERIAPGTLVQGKLANGLSLESRIRPVFVGRGFGNYADRLRRDDIEYVLTYTRPRVGYEGSVIRDVLEAYPERRVIWSVPVAESTCDCDQAALVAKHATATTARQPGLPLDAAADGDQEP